MQEGVLHLNMYALHYSNSYIYIVYKLYIQSFYYYTFISSTTSLFTVQLSHLCMSALLAIIPGPAMMQGCCVLPKCWKDSSQLASVCEMF